MNYDAAGAAEQAVVVVLTGGGETCVSAFAQAVEVATEIPAARTLAEIASDGALVAQLWSGDRMCGFGQHGIAFADCRMRGDLGKRGHRADAETSVVQRSDALQFGDAGEGDDLACAERAIAEAAQQIGTAGMHAGSG